MAKKGSKQMGGSRSKSMYPTGGAGGNKGSFSALVNQSPRQGVPSFMKGMKKK